MWRSTYLPVTIHWPSGAAVVNTSHCRWRHTIQRLSTDILRLEVGSLSSRTRCRHLKSRHLLLDIVSTAWPLTRPLTRITLTWAQRPYGSLLLEMSPVGRSADRPTRSIIRLGADVHIAPYTASLRRRLRNLRLRASCGTGAAWCSTASGALVDKLIALVVTLFVLARLP